MIQSVRPDQQPAIRAIAEAIGLFSAEELEELSGMLAAALAGELGEGHRWITYVDNAPVGVAYYAPEAYANGVWNLYFIAVHPDRQGQGIGSQLIQYVEQELSKQGERLLLVETSGLPSFSKTRAFYRKQGYEEEARIREFYNPGEDKIIFRKALS